MKTKKKTAPSRMSRTDAVHTYSAHTDIARIPIWSKKLLALMSAAVFLLTSFGCGKSSPSRETSAPAEVKKQVAAEEEEFHLRDKAPLYTAQNPTEVVTMYLTVSSGNSAESSDHTWEEINTYSVYDYDRMGVDRYKVEGLLQIGDENGIAPGEVGYNQVSPNCTVQIRGQTSSLYSQKNYKISLKDNKGQWRGQTTIALNKHQQDGLRFRNKLTYDLISGIDEMMGLRTAFVHLYVKDTTASGDGKFRDYGLYTQVEQLNKTALRAHGLDKNGHLYKINFFEFYRYEDVIKLKTDPTYDLKKFEELIEVKGSDDHKKLITMLEELNDHSIPIDTVLKKHFDTENLAYWLAFHILMGNTDTQSRNAYIYSPLNSDKWYFLTWDNDSALKRSEYKLDGRSEQLGWDSGVSNYWGNILFKRCLKSDTFRKELDSAVKDLKAYLSPGRIGALANKYAKVVKPYVYAMPDRMHAPLTSAQYDRVVDAISHEIETNYKLYRESFEKPMPFYIGVPQKIGEKYSIEWDSSFDFNAGTITYTFELARDYTFKNPIIKKENIKIPSLQFDALPAGQYFVRVKAANASGQSQYAFDYYVIDSGKVYGTKCFYVGADGKVTEDIYVEG